QASAQIILTHGLSFELPRPDASFDVVASSLFFHHLTPQNKRRTLAEVYHVLSHSGELHIADWGKAGNGLMAAASLPVQLLDGPTTKDSFQGFLPEYVREAGFSEVAETTSFNSLFGTIRLLKARKP
ncbi:MAG: methyltransferase domain-containing protein, partial [Acidobacteriota bacterium]|nr:methyltransferase domain-containing protein [Acidobacteriota bacterium]